MVRLAPLLGRRAARAHRCCVRQYEGCAVQALWGGEEMVATTHASRNSEADATRCCRRWRPVPRRRGWPRWAMPGLTRARATLAPEGKDHIKGEACWGGKRNSVLPLLHRARTPGPDAAPRFVG